MTSLPPSIDAIDLGRLAMALSDGNRDNSWFFNVDSGDVRPTGDWSEGFDDDDLYDQGWVAVEPAGGRSGFEDMEQFTAAVGDARAREVLTSSLEGKGVFRRFRDTLREFPDLKGPWQEWLESREQARAVRWLLAGDHVDELEAEAYLKHLRDQAAAVLAEVRGTGGAAFEVDGVPARWNDVVARLDAGESVTLLRDGKAFAEISVFDSPI